MAPLFPRSGPGESGSPMSSVLLRCYDFPSRIPVTYLLRFRGPRDPPRFVSRNLALPEGRRAFRARVVVQPATRSAGLLARGRERDLPGSQAIHPVPLPRSTTPAEPTIPRLFDGFVDAAPALPTAKASAVDEFRGSITRLWHLLPTLHEWCCHHPCKARFRPAGLALTGRASNPLDRYKRFQITVSSSFSGFILAQGKFHDVP